MNERIKIAVSAGEPSGDMHSAAVIRAMYSFDPNVWIRGMGGSHLRKAGVDTIVDSEKYGALNGLNIPLLLLRSIGAFFKMARLLWEWKPHLLIVTDYPDFNLRLARLAAGLFSVPVLYFIPPKLWAWRTSRIKIIKRVVDRLVLILPFEKNFYESLGYNRAIYVGHPFADMFKHIRTDGFSKNEFLKSLGLDPDNPVIALLPGSRASEVKRHLPLALAGLEHLRQTHPDLQTVLVAAPGVNTAHIKALVGKRAWIKIYHGSALDVMRSATAGLLKCGTCNLEAAYLDLPFVCFYTAPPFTASILRSIIKVKIFSLVNWIRPNTVVELIQDHASPEKIATELKRAAFDQTQKTHMLSAFEAIRAELAAYDQSPTTAACRTAAERTAKLALELAQRKKMRSKILSSLKNFLKPYRFQFLAALACMVLFGASDGVVPFLVKHVLDDIFKNHDQRMLMILPLALILFSLARAAADFGQQFLMARTGHNIVRDLRNTLNRHLLTLSPGFFLRHSCADLLARFTSDVILVRDLLTNCTAAVIRDSIRILALLVAAFYLDPVLALIAFIVLPIGFIPVYSFGRRMRMLSKRGQEAIGSLSGLIQESVLGNRVVKIFGREAYEQQCFEEENDRLNKTFVKSERVRALTGPINEVLGSLAICGVLLYGGYSVISEVRSQGDFIAFLLAVFLLYDPFKKLSQVNNQVQQGFSGAERIFELLAIPADVQDPPHPVPLSSRNDIVFDNVSFAYDGSESEALKDISLRVEEGCKLAIVGFSGAGKSTLIDLIPRFMDPQRGRIYIGGVDISKVKLSELRARIAMVGQHTFLFADTVYKNIAYGNPQASYQEVIEAAKAAYAYDFVMKLPHGFDTIIGESGLTLSGGERQRIAIARAILKNAPILILDEATASLDNKAEREVQAAIERLEENRTSLVIAHRLSTVRSADMIVVLEDGRIAESGTHSELMARGGAYARLYALQFSGDNPAMVTTEYAAH